MAKLYDFDEWVSENKFYIDHNDSKSPMKYKQYKIPKVLYKVDKQLINKAIEHEK